MNSRHQKIFTITKADCRTALSFPRTQEFILCAIWHCVMGSRLRGNDGDKIFGLRQLCEQARHYFTNPSPHDSTRFAIAAMA